MSEPNNIDPKILEAFYPIRAVEVHGIVEALRAADYKIVAREPTEKMLAVGMMKPGDFHAIWDAAP